MECERRMLHVIQRDKPRNKISRGIGELTRHSEVSVITILRRHRSVSLVSRDPHCIQPATVPELIGRPCLVHAVYRRPHGLFVGEAGV